MPGEVNFGFLPNNFSKKNPTKIRGNQAHAYDGQDYETT
jgi:hypothetical protein